MVRASRLACLGLHLFSKAPARQLEPAMGIDSICPDLSTQSQITLPGSPQKAPQELSPQDSPTNGCFGSAGACAGPSDIVPASSSYSALRRGVIPALQAKKLKPWSGEPEEGKMVVPRWSGEALGWDISQKAKDMS